MRDALSSFSSVIVRGNGSSQVEPWLDNPKPNKTRLRADIRVSKGPVVSFVDVAVSSPTLGDSVQTLLTNNFRTAFSIVEKDKSDKYKANYADAIVKQVVPFVLEATGRWGTSALKFVDNLVQPPNGGRIPKEASDAKKFLKQRVSVILMRGHHNLVVNGRSFRKFADSENA